MYEKGLFGVASAEGLVNTLRLLNTINFGLRGCEEHRQMTWGDVKVAQETDGSDYLEYTERQTKTKSETEPRNIRTVKPKAFAAPNGLPERNPVFVYKLYTQKRPDIMLKPDAPFYLGINHTRSSVPSSSNKSWFKSSANQGTN